MSAPSAMSISTSRSASSTLAGIHLMAAPIAELRCRVRRLAKRTVEAGAVLRRVRHDRRSARSRARRACVRIAATRPSIMSDGATMSAPATACDSAACASCMTVTSLTISSPSTMPQWPCDVYSHRQTSVMTRRSRTSRLSARTAVCTGASGSAAARADRDPSCRAARTAGPPARPRPSRPPLP